MFQLVVSEEFTPPPTNSQKTWWLSPARLLPLKWFWYHFCKPLAPPFFCHFGDKTFYVVKNVIPTTNIEDSELSLLYQVCHRSPKQFFPCVEI